MNRYRTNKTESRTVWCGLCLGRVFARVVPVLAFLLLTGLATVAGGCAPKDDGMSGGGSSTVSPAQQRRQHLLGEIQELREDIRSGKVMVDWNPPVGSYMPSDPLELLDDLEASLLASDITAYIADDAGDAAGLREELASRPEVEKLAFLGKEAVLKRLQERLGDQVPPSDAGNLLPAEVQIWVSDPSSTIDLVEELETRAEVRDAVTNSADLEYWLNLLRESLRPK